MNPNSPNHPFPPFSIKKHPISTTPTATSGPLKSDEVGYDEFLLGDSCPPMSQFEESQLIDESPYLYGSDFTDDESEKVGPNRLACEVSSGVVGGSVANGPGGTPTTPDHSNFCIV